jgi:hypothetical protein
MTRFFGVLSTVFIIGFLAFGFREVFRQKAAARKDRGPPPSP